MKKNEVPDIVSILALFNRVLTFTYFFLGGYFYEKTDEVAVGSPESPVIANFFMGVLEERALEKFPISLYSFRYVDDAFVIWPHGPEKLERLLNYLSGPHRNIQFAMQTEKDIHLPFSTSTATGDRAAFWTMRSAEILPLQTSVSTPDYTTIIPA